MRKWSLRSADQKFRKHLLKGDLQCAFPGCRETREEKLTVSHYIPRAKKGTRFDPLNCDFLCRTHHYWDKYLGWEFQKQNLADHGWDGRYTLYMKQKLGVAFDDLIKRSQEKISAKAAFERFLSTADTTQQQE